MYEKHFKKIYVIWSNISKDKFKMYESKCFKAHLLQTSVFVNETIFTHNISDSCLKYYVSNKPKRTKKSHIKSTFCFNVHF